MTGGSDFPCDWPFCDPPCCPEWADAAPEDRERAKRLATYYMWVATGRYYGRCETTIRPCRRSCIDPARTKGTWSGGRWMPVLSGGRWYNVDCGCVSHRCSCTAVCEIELEGWYPEPVQVQIDGETIPLYEFRVDNGRRLVWEGDDCFPMCQDLSRPLGEPGTWAITYRHGLPVPTGGAEATGELACELLLACNPDTADQCRLPANVQSVSRQGVDLDFTNTTAPGRGFGVPSIDMWVEMVNPRGFEPFRIYSPDVSRPVVTTWP